MGGKYTITFYKLGLELCLKKYNLWPMAIDLREAFFYSLLHINDKLTKNPNNCEIVVLPVYAQHDEKER